jgi:signal transduction histidine kinase
MLAATLLYLAVPDTRLAYRSRPLEAAFETAVAAIAGLAAALLAGRAGRGAERSQALLCAGLSVLAISNFFFGALPPSLGFEDVQFQAWATALASLLGAALLAASVLAPAPRRKIPPGIAVGLAAAGVAVIALMVAGLDLVLPMPFDTGVSPRHSPLLEGNVTYELTALLAALLFGATCVGALRRVEHRRDEIVGWLAVGVSLAALSRLLYAFIPSSTTEWISAADCLRAGWYILLLVGITREIRIYQRAAITSAVSEERKRIARDVHDGLVQDLAYLSSASSELERGQGETVPEMRAVSLRAMHEARRLLDALAGGHGHAGSGAELESEAAQAARRHGVQLDCSLDPHADLPTPTRRQLSRIIGEAVTNAARHGHAQRVRVRLRRRGHSVTLRVIDDGTGFEPDDVSGNGFGLRSMRERAGAIGGELSVTSARGSGTTVEVNVP